MKVAIVGAGIVGAACAMWLARDGHALTIIDARGPGSGATAAGMGHLLVLDDDPASLALTHRSMQLWHGLAPSLPTSSEWSSAGTLWVAEDEAQLAHGEDRVESLRAAGVEAELVSSAKLASLAPCLAEDLAGALWVSGDRVIYPPAVAAWMLARSRAALVRARVERVEPGVLVTDEGRRIEADAIVLACGLATGALVARSWPGHPVASTIRPRKGQLIITTPTRLGLEHQLVELGYHDSVGASGARVAFNVQPRPHGQVLIGSSRDDDVDAGGTSLDRKLLARMVARARRFVPALEDALALRAWAGLRPASVDGLPLIGPLPGIDGVWLAAGHEGLGITTSVASAELIAAQLGGADSMIDPQPFDPGRFVCGQEARDVG